MIRDIIVEVNVSDLASKGTNFVDDGSHFVRLPAGANNVFFEVQTKTDDTATADGVLQAIIQNGAGYTHSTSSNTAYLEIHDADNTDFVELTVTADNSSVYQGDMMTFTISRTGDTTNSVLDFKYDLIDTENVIDDAREVENETGTILAGESSLVLPTLTTQDAATSYTAAAGVTLRIRSASENTAATYRVE